MQVRAAMSGAVLTIGPQHSVLDAARLMVERHVGAAVVVDDSLPGPGIFTERDVMRAIAAGADPAEARVEEWMTFDARAASDTWGLDEAADEMVRNNFRHLLVVDSRGRLCGVVSMRDVVRARVRGAGVAG